MDIISFNEAATANSRIESFNANPDSTSGVVTVPKVIASGETITIPAGRVAVLPNVQIDGVLNVENGGEVFIPSGSTLSTVVEKVASTDNAIVRFDGTTGAVKDSNIFINSNGNLNITGTGKRITGDFSNATFSDRLAFQTSINDGATFIGAVPNGVNKTSGFATYNNQDGNNASIGYFSANDTAVRIISVQSGTGSELPITFNVGGGSERMRIDTGGNVLVTGGGGLGYGTGSGGTVTQLTSKSTAVTLNKSTGQITMNNATLAAGASVTFNLNNSLLSSHDTLHLTMEWNSTTSYRFEQAAVGVGITLIRVTNISGSSFSEALQIKFNILKGANS